MKTHITFERVHEVLTYESGSGLLRWKKRTGSRCKGVGEIAGFRSKVDGRMYVTVDGRRYFAHRLIWFMVTGSWPIEVDHKDGDPSNNRWSNLREGTHAQNQQNMALPSHNKSGFMGVFWDNRDQCWRAVIKLHQRQIWLGRFNTAEEGAKAYQAAKKQYHTYCGELRGGRSKYLRSTGRSAERAE